MGPLRVRSAFPLHLFQKQVSDLFQKESEEGQAQFLLRGALAAGVPLVQELLLADG